MTRYALRALAAHLRSGPSLYALTVFGVALGVASVLCIQIINRNAIAAFEASVRAISPDADLSVVGRLATFPERLYAAVLAEAGVADAWPLCRIDVAVAGGQRGFLEVVGIDLFAPLRLPWRGEPGDLSAALGRPGWIAVTPGLAAEMGWAVGDAFEVTSGSRRVRLEVGALVDFQRRSPQASRRLAVMDIAQVQDLLGHPGALHQIDVRAVPTADLTDLASRLAARLGPSVEVLTPTARLERTTGLLGAFRLNLTALSLISLFVGLFLVHATTQAALVRRRQEFGVLRCLGATRAQVVGLILAEVALLGAFGVALGLPLGYWAAAANVDVVSGTLTNLYLLEAIESLVLPPWIVGLAALIGVGGAVAGALLPTLDMGRAETRLLLSSLVVHEEAGTAALPLFVAGWISLALAGLWFWTMGRTWKPAGFVLGLVLLLAIPLLTPFLVRETFGRARLAGFGLGYSLRSLGARLQSTSFAVAALAIAVSMLIGITLLIGSFRRTLEVWVETSVQADVYVTTESWTRARSEATLSETLASTLAAHSGVVAVDRLRQFFSFSRDRRVSVSGVETRLAGGEGRFPLLSGEPAETLRQLHEEGAVLVSEPLARKAGLSVGDRLPIAGVGGELWFRIAGIYYDYRTEGGAVVMDLHTMRERFGPGRINNLALYLAPGRDPEQVVDELRRRVSGAPLVIRSNRRLREEIFGIFDQTFAVTRILQGMSLLIAVSGVTLTLLVQARERLSELAVCRALGASRGQLFAIFVGKGAGMALLALGLGLGGGLGLAGILIYVINRAYFGWTIQAYWPGASVGQQVAVILGAAVVASLYPALRASQAPITELSRDDR